LGQETERFAALAAALTTEGVTNAAILEHEFRQCALSCGSDAMSRYLTALPEDRPRCSVCGTDMKSEGLRSKSVVSMLGEGSYLRRYWTCPECGTHAVPKDKAVGLFGTSFTLGIKRASARLGGRDAFAGGSEALLELCGVFVSTKEVERMAEAAGKAASVLEASLIKAAFSPAGLPASEGLPTPVMYVECDGTGLPMVSAELSDRPGKQPDGSSKTREMKVGCVFTQSATDKDGLPVRDERSTTYVAAIECADEFGRRLYAEAVSRGSAKAVTLVVIGDGAKWVWNLADTHFPGAVQIVDLYHAKEHLFKLIKGVVTDDEKRRRLEGWLVPLLEGGDIPALLKGIHALPAADAQQSNLIDGEAAYFEGNAKRMDYASFRARGLFVGSGVIEAACKNVIGKRMKQSGMHWSVRGANCIAALRCAILSGRFDSVFPEAA
jgi:hypothetical protein